MSVAIPVIKWWLALSIIGWLAVPISYVLFAPLRDRGYAFARPLGLLICGYIFWLGVTVGAIPNSSAGAWFTVLACAAIGLWLAATRRGELIGFLRERRRLVVGYEVLLVVVLAGWALYRAHNPAIETAGGEKYMEMAFINAVLASPRFPPLDPWLSGFAISYYYFGYVIAALLIRLTLVSPFVAFNLVVPMTLALSITGAFSLGYDMVALGRRATRRARVVIGASSASLLALLGSLEGALELALLRGWLPRSFFEWLNIRDLSAACGGEPSFSALDGTGFVGAGAQLVDTARRFASWCCGAEYTPPEGLFLPWVPTRHIWWWRGSRVIHDDCGEVIHEFPFFSFMLGDNHPHVLALPMGLMVLGLALAVLAGRLEDRGVARHFSPLWLVLPFAVGSLGFLNSWDLPTYAVVLVAAYGLRAWTRPPLIESLTEADFLLALVAWGAVGWLSWRFSPVLIEGFAQAPVGPVSPWPRLAIAALVMAGAAAAAYWLWRQHEEGRAHAGHVVEVAYFAAWLLVLAVAFYLPFHVGFSSQASGIGTVLIRTRLPQWLVHFGLLSFLAVSLVSVALASVLRRLRSPTLLSLLVVSVALPVAAYSLLVQAWTALLLVGLVAAASVALIEGWVAALARPSEPPGAEGKADDDDPEAPVVAAEAAVASELSAPRLPVARTFALLCVAIGLLLPLGTEFLFVKDLFGSRMNSIFKLYFQAWILLSIGGGYTLYVVWRRLPRPGAIAWSIPLAILVAASAVYPVAATYSRTRRPPDEPLTLNGLRWWELRHPDDLAVAQWLRENAEATPTILEADGGGYEHNGRISMATGFPTVLGWRGHEHQWRGTMEEIDPRAADVERAYTTRSQEEFGEIMEEYGVRYVILGALERSRFRLAEGDVERLKRWLTPVFESGDTMILKRR